MPNSKLHKTWRKEAKKLRRKKIRQRLAIKRERFAIEIEIAKCSDGDNTEDEARVSEYNHKKWLEREAEAQRIFAKAKRKQEEDERAKELERQRIKAEYDAEIKRQKDVADAKKRAVKEEQERARRLMEELNEYVQGNSEILPVELTMASESNPGRDLCHFFTKTGVCRFGMSCSKNHIRPGVSRTLLVANFFSNISLEQSRKTEYGNDITLETDDHELRDQFEEFFYDVITELESFGKLDQFQVCRNALPHLRGNVYVQYEQQRYGVDLSSVCHLKTLFSIAGVPFEHIKPCKAAIMLAAG
jgi:U2 small nuclear ribonucleoprotein auxiliary factor 35 kDa subunit-related protein